LVDLPEAWLQLGHDYRVIVHVTTWSSADALTIPVSALFRKRDQWAVFVDENGRAQALQSRSAIATTGWQRWSPDWRRAIGLFCIPATELPMEAGSHSEKSADPKMRQMALRS
jgi:hypothetical protein